MPPVRHTAEDLRVHAVSAPIDHGRRSAFGAPVDAAIVPASELRELIRAEVRSGGLQTLRRDKETLNRRSGDQENFELFNRRLGGQEPKELVLALARSIPMAS